MQGMQALIGWFPPRSTLAKIFARQRPLIWDDVKMRIEIVPCVLKMKSIFEKRRKKNKSQI
ncbi:hypothetical protein T4E_10402 [Trichinella pseudospiralis]|uniref:Uncharacterized protein n=1 Tax=Trichinella pseudospiralis TaxID=6337 RepID=A0A0V0YJ35_TRIPS|nr:hypothetical protein T4E_10402 [Trichinella pseudospiralis]